MTMPFLPPKDVVSGHPTPTTDAGLHRYDHLDAVTAVVLAWVRPARRPGWHRQMQSEVRAAMPVLARALDRLTQHHHSEDE